MATGVAANIRDPTLIRRERSLNMIVTPVNFFLFFPLVLLNIFFNATHVHIKSNPIGDESQIISAPSMSLQEKAIQYIQALLEYLCGIPQHQAHVGVYFKTFFHPLILRI